MLAGIFTIAKIEGPLNFRGTEKKFASNFISFIFYEPEIQKINGSMAPENSGAHRPHHYSLASYGPVVDQQCTIGNATSVKRVYIKQWPNVAEGVEHA